MIYQYRDMPPSFFLGAGLAVAGIGIGLGIGIFGMAGCEARSKEAYRQSEIRKNELNTELQKMLLQAKQEGMNVQEFLEEYAEGMRSGNPIAAWVERALEDPQEESE